jgi:TrwC relaxase
VNVAVMATVAKGYDLDYAWRAVGEAYRSAGYYLAAVEAGEPPGTWWGPGAERLGFTVGQQVEREPYNLLFGQRKGPDGEKRPDDIVVEGHLDLPCQSRRRRPARPG